MRSGGVALLVVMLYVLIAAVFVRSTWGAPPPMPPETDGCTFWPDGDWVECCHQHDYEYWFGGTFEERALSDARLSWCVQDKGHSFIAALMLFGVRIGGMCWIPWSHRWGHGWPWPACGGET